MTISPTLIKRKKNRNRKMEITTANFNVVILNEVKDPCIWLLSVLLIAHFAEMLVLQGANKS